MPSRPYNSKDVEPVVTQINREIRTLLTERNAINKRIDTIKKALVGLATLVGDDALVETLGLGKSGITKACRHSLMNAENPLLASEVYELLCQQRPGLLANHDSTMISLYAVLARLVKRGEIRMQVDDNGRHTWLWIRESCDQVKSCSDECRIIQ